MQKIKCECGWEGNKYFLLISIDGNKCPKCENIITEDLNGWISVDEKLPTKKGWYKVKTTMGDYEVPFASKLDGSSCWLVPGEEIKVTHWAEI